MDDCLTINTVFDVNPTIDWCSLLVCGPDNEESWVYPAPTFIVLDQSNAGVFGHQAGCLVNLVLVDGSGTLVRGSTDLSLKERIGEIEIGCTITVLDWYPIVYASEDHTIRLSLLISDFCIQVPKEDSVLSITVPVQSIYNTKSHVSLLFHTILRDDNHISLSRASASDYQSGSWICNDGTRSRWMEIQMGGSPLCLPAQGSCDCTHGGKRLGVGLFSCATSMVNLEGPAKPSLIRSASQLSGFDLVGCRDTHGKPEFPTKGLTIDSEWENLCPRDKRWLKKVDTSFALFHGGPLPRCVIDFIDGVYPDPDKPGNEMRFSFYGYGGLSSLTEQLSKAPLWEHSLVMRPRRDLFKAPCRMNPFMAYSRGGNAVDVRTNECIDCYCFDGKKCSCGGRDCFSCYCA